MHKIPNRSNGAKHTKSLQSVMNLRLLCIFYLFYILLFIDCVRPFINFSSESERERERQFSHFACCAASVSYDKNNCFCWTVHCSLFTIELNRLQLWAHFSSFFCRRWSIVMFEVLPLFYFSLCDCLCAIRLLPDSCCCTEYDLHCNICLLQFQWQFFKSIIKGMHLQISKTNITHRNGLQLTQKLSEWFCGCWLAALVALCIALLSRNSDGKQWNRKPLQNNKTSLRVDSIFESRLHLRKFFVYPNCFGPRNLPLAFDQFFNLTLIWCSCKQQEHGGQAIK